MKRAVITIENGIVSVPASGNIWGVGIRNSRTAYKSVKKTDFFKKMVACTDCNTEELS